MLGGGDGVFERTVPAASRGVESSGAGQLCHICLVRMLWPPEYTYHVNSDGSSPSKTVYQQCNSGTDRWHIGRKLVVAGIGYETQVWHSQCQPQFLANQSFQLCLGLHARSLLAPDEARSSQFCLPQREESSRGFRSAHHHPLRAPLTCQ